MFHQISMPPEDALHGVMARYAADPRADKIDLGVGVYRDETGASPIMQAVKSAEAVNIKTQKSKSYLPLRGVDLFLDGMTQLVFPEQDTSCFSCVQAVGGTGGIRLALELAKRANPDIRVIIGTPTWPNHFTICQLLNIETVSYPYFDKVTQTLLFESLCTAIREARSGDILVLHGPCHNPTGVDLSRDQLKQIMTLASEKDVIPLIDAAYYGLGSDLGHDLEGLAELVKSVPRAMLIVSCSKAFGLYRERTAILFVKTESPDQSLAVQKTLERLGRGLYSMPPAYGAAIVGKILNDEDLTLSWKTELAEMRQRIISVRQSLALGGRKDSRLSEITSQKGIFSLLPISPEIVKELAVSEGIYMPSSGRINIAGFKTGDVERFISALSKIG